MDTSLHNHFIFAASALLVPLAGIITYYDVRYRRIPNVFVLATLVCGLTLNTLSGGAGGRGGREHGAPPDAGGTGNLRGAVRRGARRLPRRRGRARGRLAARHARRRQGRPRCFHEDARLLTEGWPGKRGGRPGAADTGLNTQP